MTALMQKIKSAVRRPRGVGDLLLFGWRGTLASILGGLVISVLLFGVWWPYWTVADMDFWVVYNAFLLNDGLPQEFFDHPAYLTIVLLAAWFRLLHAAGLLAVHTLSALPPPQDAAAAWTHAVQAGRVLSLLLAAAFVVSFAALLRRLMRDWRVAAIGAFLLAFSGGLMMQVRIMRTELIASGLTVIALLVLLISARSERNALRPLALFTAALLATLGMLNKVQVIFLIGALPLLVMPAGRPIAADRDFWRTSRSAMPVAAVIVAVAVGLAALAWPLLEFGLSPRNLTQWRPLAFGLYGVYQPLIALWFAGAMLLFARLYRVSALETVTAMAGVVGGIALGLLALTLVYQPQDLLVVLNPIEQMSHMTGDATASASGNIASTKMLAVLLDNLATVAAKRTFVLNSSARPTIFLEWLVIAMTIAACRAGRTGLALQSALMMAVVWGIDTTSTFRGLKLEYFIFTDPITVIAACMLLGGLPERWNGRYAYPVGAVLFVAHILVSHAEPVKHSLRRDLPMDFCQKNFYYTKRIESYSYCPR